MIGEVRRRGHNRGTVIGRDPNGHHVLLNELAVLHPGIEAAGDQVQACFVRADVQHDIGVVAGELGEFGTEHAHRPEGALHEA